MSSEEELSTNFRLEKTVSSEDEELSTIHFRDAFLTGFDKTSSSEEELSMTRFGTRFFGTDSEEDLTERFEGFRFGGDSTTRRVTFRFGSSSEDEELSRTRFHDFFLRTGSSEEDEELSMTRFDLFLGMTSSDEDELMTNLFFFGIGSSDDSE